MSESAAEIRDFEMQKVLAEATIPPPTTVYQRPRAKTTFEIVRTFTSVAALPANVTTLIVVLTR
jgi:hypothetical protein